MKKTTVTVTCDKCSRLIDGDYRVIQFCERGGMEDWSEQTELKVLDLCDDCYRELERDWL